MSPALLPESLTNLGFFVKYPWLCTQEEKILTAVNSSFETLVSTTDSALSILRKVCTYIMVPDSYIDSQISMDIW